MMKTEPTKEDVTQAYKMGCRACIFMAREIERLFTDLLALEDCEPKFVMPVIEFSINPTMQTLGDLLNAMDSVDDEAENATAAAFVAVKKVLSHSR